MASQALYRKWRSQRFADLIGQEPVARTLRNAARTNRIAHAYLFCGPRGVGKTSAARILAKAVNCLDAVDGEPCAVCEMCRAIQDGTAIDVMEIDAASNRGIDEIRGIREKVGLAPASARYKFYILDEAHMLTVDAFNALLKTLEEPPANTVFVLVTTEAQRLPETVLSRCQRLDFRRISVPDAISRLAYVCQQEGITPEAGVLELLARTAAGSLRDAEVMLDQIVAYAGPQPTLAAARSVLGAAGPDAARDLLVKITDDRVADAIRTVNDLVDQGVDPRQVSLEVVGCLRNILLLRTSETLVDLIDEGQEAISELRQIAQKLAPRQLVELIRIFTPVPSSRTGLRPQLPLEMSIVEAARALRDVSQAPGAPTVSAAPVGVADRPEIIAPQAPGEVPAPARGSPRSGTGSSRPSAAPSRSDSEAATSPAPTVTARAAAQQQASASPGILWGDVARRWTEVLDVCGAMSRSVQALLSAGRPIGADGDAVVLGFKYPFHRERIEDQKNRAIVEEAIARVCGTRVRIRCSLINPEALPPSDSTQAALDDPLVRAAVSMGARVRRVKEDNLEEK